MPLAKTARRLGHSVETLVCTYVGALDDEEHIANQRIANQRIDTYLDASTSSHGPGAVTTGECDQVSRRKRDT